MSKTTPTSAKEGLRHRTPSRISAEMGDIDLADPGNRSRGAASATSETYRLWLMSRQRSTKQTKLQPAGESRKLTLHNARLAFQLLQLIWWEAAAMIWGSHRAEFSMYMVDKIVKALVPAFRVWATSRFLDEVQASLSLAQSRSEVTPNRSGLLLLGGLSLMANLANDILDVANMNRRLAFRRRLEYSIEKTYMSYQLSLDIPTLSRVAVRDLMYEAGCFAGKEKRLRKGRFCGNTSIEGNMNTLFGLMTRSIEVVSTAALLFRTLSTAMATNRMAEDMGNGTTNSTAFTRRAGLIIALSFLPSLIRAAGTTSTFIWKRYQNTIKTFAYVERMRGLWRRVRPRFPHKDRKDNFQRRWAAIDTISELGGNGEYKHEVVLFGLKNWVLAKWDALWQQQLKSDINANREFAHLSLYNNARDEGIQTVFHLLLAVGSFGTSVTLGSIRLYQATAETLFHSSKALVGNAKDAIQLVFCMAAFIEMRRVAEALNAHGRHHLEEILGDHNDGGSVFAEPVGRRIPFVEYEDTRSGRGMRIEAKKLGFRYPGASKDALRGVNLTIEAGSTVAIVGVNGGGKTTLVKVLMGLYDHTGDLSINGVPIQCLSPQQLHERTTICFQDFGRLSLSLRENVGIGDIARLSNDSAVNSAMRCGGADAIRDVIGLDGPLSRRNAPSVATGSSTISNLVPSVEGFALSGGQWQRIALSRAFMRATAADLVIFDEPSAALDARAEAELFESIHGLATQVDDQKPTTIFTSHRFATIRRADSIIVMEDGTILESGTHETLMAEDGRYAELFNLQRQGFE